MTTERGAAGVLASNIPTPFRVIFLTDTALRIRQAIGNGVPLAAGCDYDFTEEEILKQAEPQLAAIGEKKALDAFKNIPGFKPGKK